MIQILGVGNALVDTLVKVDNPEIFSELNLAKGGMTLIDEPTFQKMRHRLKNHPIERATGGSASNALLAAASLKAKAAFIGKTGKDDNGDFYARTRSAQGVHPFALHHSTLPTGTCTSFILPDGQRTMATYLGASATLSGEDLRAEWFEGVRFVFVEGYLVQDHALIQQAFTLSHAAGARVCLDLAAWNIVEQEHSFLSQLLSQTDIVFANEEEACAMLRMPHEDFDGEQAARQLAKHCGGTAVVKVGARGAWAVHEQEVAFVPAVPVNQVVDTTAAGDFFAGAFLAAQVRGASLIESLQAGALCAAEVIQVMGTAMEAEAWTRLTSKQ